MSKNGSYSDDFQDSSRCTTSGDPTYEDSFKHVSSAESHNLENSLGYSESDTDKCRHYSSDTENSRHSSYDSESYSASDNGKSRQSSGYSENYSNSDAGRGKEYSDDFEDYSLSGDLRSRQYSEYSESYSTSSNGISRESSDKSDTVETAQYSDDFEETSTRSRSIYKAASSSRYSNDSKTVRTSIADTVPEATIISAEDTESGELSEGTQYSGSYEDSTRFTGTGSSFSTTEYSDQLDTSSKSSYTTESGSARQHPSRTTSYTESPTDHSTWADSSEYSEGTSEATYLVEHNFITKILGRLKQQPTEARVKKVNRVLTQQEQEALKLKKALCRKLITRIKNKKDVLLPHKAEDSTRLRLLGLNGTDPVQDHGVSHLAVNRLRLENTRSRYEEMIQAPIHNPHKCHYCISAMELLAKDSFIKERFHVAQEQWIKEKLDTPCSLSTTLMMDPAILPGRLHEELSRVGPRHILAMMASRAQNEAKDPKEQTSLNEDFDVRHLEHVVSGVSNLRLCPYMQRTHKAGPVIQDAMSEEISRYIQKTDQQVDAVKQDLLNEMQRLHGLSSDAFWNLYFSRLQHAQSSLDPV